jgi:hypothetical protein
MQTRTIVGAFLILLVAGMAAVPPPAIAAVRQDGTSTQHLAGPAGGSPRSGAITITQWHKLNVDATNFKVLFQYHNNRAPSVDAITLVTEADGTTLDVITIIAGSVSKTAAAVQSIAVGTWYFYAITRNGSTIRLYIGSESSPARLVATLTDARLAVQDIVWRWTATGSSTATLSADASIEQFKIYNAELTQSQIDAERTSLSPSSTTRLWSYNPFTTAGLYSGADGSNPMTFTTQGGGNFSTVSGPAPAAVGATEPTPSGYEISIRCPCGVAFLRWVAPTNAAYVCTFGRGATEMTDQRHANLAAALGFLEIAPRAPELVMLHRWGDS